MNSPEKNLTVQGSARFGEWGAPSPTPLAAYMHTGRWPCLPGNRFEEEEADYRHLREAPFENTRFLWLRTDASARLGYRLGDAIDLQAMNIQRVLTIWQNGGREIAQKFLDRRQAEFDAAAATRALCDPSFIYGYPVVAADVNYKVDSVYWPAFARSALKGHGLVFGGTGSGKFTASMALQGLNWPGPMFVVDPKGEFDWACRKFREGRLHQPYFALDPHEQRKRFFDDDTPQAHYNPLDLLTPGDPNYEDDVLAIAGILIETEGNEPHWVHGARFLVAGLIAVVKERFPDGERHLGTVHKILGGNMLQVQRFIKTFLDEDPDALNFSTQLLGEFVRLNQDDMNELADDPELAARQARIVNNKEGDGHRSTARKQLGFLFSPAVLRSLSKSDFAWTDFLDRPVTVTAILPVEKVPEHRRWLRLITECAIRTFVRHKRPASRILCLLDEFGELGPLPSVEVAFTSYRGYGVSVVGYLQGVKQLARHYKESWETILGNCQFKLFLGGQDVPTTEWFSREAGKATRQFWTVTQSDTTGGGKSIAFASSSTVTSGGGTTTSYGAQSQSSSNRNHSFANTSGITTTYSDSWSSTRGRNEHLVQRDLLDPSELRRLGPEQAVLLEGGVPYLIHKLRYFEDVRFAGLYRPHPEFPETDGLRPLIGYPPPPSIAAKIRLLSKPKRLWVPGPLGFAALAAGQMCKKWGRTIAMAVTAVLLSYGVGFVREAIRQHVLLGGAADDVWGAVVSAFSAEPKPPPD